MTYAILRLVISRMFAARNEALPEFKFVLRVKDPCDG